MDTNVLYAAMDSRRGASFEILHRLRVGEWTAVLSNHLVYEYEEILKRRAVALRLSLDGVDQVLAAICARGEPWSLLPGWRPILTDPDDEPLVQLACESGAQWIVSHNAGHLWPATNPGNSDIETARFPA